MSRTVSSKEQYIGKNRFIKRWRKLLLALSCIVVFCITYALILPAITMEQLSELSEEAQTRVGAVVACIDRLPDNDEISDTLRDYEAAEDMDAYDEYLSTAADNVRSVYILYEDLTEEEKAAVSNADKLLTLSWLWSAETIANESSLTVRAVDGYAESVMLIRHGKTPAAVKSGMNFTNWYAVVVESDPAGNLYVAKTYIEKDTVKKDLKANTEKGFVLLTYNQSFSVSLKQTVTVSFDYTKVTGVNSAGYGTITFSDRDNSSKLTVVQGADTSKLIEVNLYDYNSKINELYQSNKKYPGFQQDKGQLTATYTYSSNFGNNITADLGAGISSVTNQGGDINKTSNVNNSGAANSPVSGAMLSTLKDGYPALKDGTSLSYLFSNSAYASKKNTASINGLFIYHPDTGAYTFNSRENHAQFNASNNTFTLYKQTISSNVFWYPFGNFLPFNDIVHESIQASSMTREYMQTVAASAKAKADSGAGTQYSTLSSTMTSWIALMDKQYPSGWGAAQAANEYFNSKSGPGGKLDNETFDFSGQTALLNNIYSIDFDEETDFYFGMEMKMQFMQPKNGLTGTDGKQPLVFYFTGDDDVWIYVDGVLFLDLSGIHRHVGGEIDFVNGLVKYYYLDVATGDVSTQPYKTVTFAELLGSSEGLNEKGAFKDYTSHSFNFYYMERGAGSGVCRMNFNFPLLHKNAISVTKQLELDEGDAALLGDPDFKFQVLREDGETLFIKGGTEYTILDSAGNEIGSGVTDANGVFAIKANQTAVFSEISENAGKYFVRELLDAALFAQYGTVTINGTSETTNYDITVGSDSFKGVDSPVKDVADGSTVFSFTNEVVSKNLGSLSIEKKLNLYSEALSDDMSFDFAVTLDGKPLPIGTQYTVGEEVLKVTQEGIITLAPDRKAVIGNILAGTKFTVEETEASAGDYVVGYVINGTACSGGKAEGTVGLGTAVFVTVNNSEKGASVNIPVQKRLEASDGRSHTYTFTLTQIDGPETQQAVPGGLNETISLEITDMPVSGAFVINYPQSSFKDAAETKLYYRITENDPGEIGTAIDRTVYIAEVTVTRTDDGNITASVTQLYKNGEYLDTGQGICFVNRLSSYVLPETGGMGSQPYTAGGVLLISAALLMYYIQKRRRGDGSSA